MLRDSASFAYLIYFCAVFLTLYTVTTYPLSSLQKQDFKSCIKIVYHLLNVDSSFQFFAIMKCKKHPYSYIFICISDYTSRIDFKKLTVQRVGIFLQILIILLNCPYL